MDVGWVSVAKSGQFGAYQGKGVGLLGVHPDVSRVEAGSSANP